MTRTVQWKEYPRHVKATKEKKKKKLLLWDSVYELPHGHPYGTPVLVGIYRDRRDPRINSLRCLATKPLHWFSGLPIVPKFLSLICLAMTLPDGVEFAVFNSLTPATGTSGSVPTFRTFASKLPLSPSILGRRRTSFTLTGPRFPWALVRKARPPFF